MGLDAMPYDHPARVGMIGSHGNRWANLALGRCDLLLVLGSRLDVRQTGADLSGFVRGKTLIRVDIDDHELRSKHLGGRDICCDVGAFLRAVTDVGGLPTAHRGSPRSPSCEARGRTRQSTPVAPASIQPAS